MNGAKAKDDDLIKQAQAGDAEALERLLEAHQGQIYRFSMKMCREPEDAREVLQDAMLTVVRSLPQFRGESSFSSWLYTIARSICIKRRRTGKHAPKEMVPIEEAMVDSGALASTSARPDHRYARRQFQTALDDALSALDPELREAVVLRDVEGLSAKETAEVVGVSVAALKSRLHRGRKALRDALLPLLQDIPEYRDAPVSGDCPDVLKLYSEFLEGEISSALCDRMQQHIQTCEACGLRCDSLKETLLVCQSVPTPAVPTAVQDAVRLAIRDLAASFG